MNTSGEPPVRESGDTTFIKKRAPTLYFIIGFKLIKGALLVTLAITAFALSDNDLPAEFRHLLHFLKLDPEKEFWSSLAEKVGSLTEANVLWVAVGTVMYSLFSWVEGIGLIFRARWAGLLAIGESAFFVPIEVVELVKRYSTGLLVILALNVLIVCYLYQNRDRLFRHHHHHHH